MIKIRNLPETNHFTVGNHDCRYSVLRFKIKQSMRHGQMNPLSGIGPEQAAYVAVKGLSTLVNGLLPKNVERMFIPGGNFNQTDF